MNALEVSGLKKSYGDFSLDVSFALEQGKITGFIGRNGAGKTTTIKSLLGFVHPDAGTVTVAGQTDEFYIKQRVGCMFGGVDYYPREKIGRIARVTSRFYDNWDNGAFLRYLERFELDPNKRVKELSAGITDNAEWRASRPATTACRTSCPISRRPCDRCCACCAPTGSSRPDCGSSPTRRNSASLSVGTDDPCTALPTL